MKTIGIYKITNLVNGKIYIGSSEEIENRWNAHFNQLMSEKHINIYLKRAWKKYGEQNFKFEIIEKCDQEILIQREQYYLNTLLFAQEYIRKEDVRFLKLGYNINPTAGKSRKGTTQTLSSIKQGLTTSGRNRRIIVVNSNNEKIDEFDYLFELLAKYNIPNQTVYISIKKKQFTIQGIGFLYEEDFIKGNKLKKPKLGSRELGMPYQGPKRKVFVYTLYGKFFLQFEDLHQCAVYFNTTPGNIYRKMNILFNKRNLIDSELTKYLVVDEFTNIDPVTIYWNNIFSKISSCEGEFKIYDCFGNYLGCATSKKLSEILEITVNTINISVKRNSYVRTLKLTKCK
jgi:hypothetical protein